AVAVRRWQGGLHRRRLLRTGRCVDRLVLRAATKTCRARELTDTEKAPVGAFSFHFIVCGLPDQIVRHLVLRVGVGIIGHRRRRVDLQRHARREYRLGFSQQRRRHQDVAAVLLQHTQFTGVERLELFGVDVDALDLAAVFKMAGAIGLRIVQTLVLDQRLHLGARLAAQPGFFLFLPLRFDALVRLALRTDGIGLGQVDVFLRARLARALLTTRCRPAGMRGLAALAGLVARLRTALPRLALRAA